MRRQQKPQRVQHTRISMKHSPTARSLNSKARGADSNTKVRRLRAHWCTTIMRTTRPPCKRRLRQHERLSPAKRSSLPSIRTCIQEQNHSCKNDFVLEYKCKKIVVAFHPHLYSRTKSFLQEFAEALASADRAIVAPIYAARGEADPSVSNEIL